MQHGVIQPDGRLYVDNSILATEAVCQTHASLRYGLGYDAPGVRVKMNVGTAVHAGMWKGVEHGAQGLICQMNAILIQNVFLEPSSKWKLTRID